MKDIVAIIPARMGSTRFPGKPMAQIHGVPMVGHVYFRTNRGLELTNIQKCLDVGACGTAFYAGLVAKYLFEQLASQPMECDIASEFRS